MKHLPALGSLSRRTILNRKQRANTARRRSSRASACVALLLAACATRGALQRTELVGSGRELAASGFQEWLRGDANGAAARFAEAVKRDPLNPWARLGAAWSARRVLDDAAESEQLLALVENAPDHPLAPVALRRLGELSELAPPLGGAATTRLAPLLASGRLRGMAAYRARTALSAAADAQGEEQLAARLRAENGIVTAWTLVGPCGAYHALELDRSFPPETGALRCPAPPGVPEIGARVLSFPQGTTSLEGEPATGDIYYLITDVRVTRGGRYLVAVGATVALESFLDGEPLVTRRPFENLPPLLQVVARSIGTGTHRLVLKLGRHNAAAATVAAIVREDGAPSDAVASPAQAERTLSPPPRPFRFQETLGSARTLARALEPEAGPVLARLIASYDQLDLDREGSKALLGEAQALQPQAAPVLVAVGDALRGDSTLAHRVAQARAEAAYSQALARDPEDGGARLKLAELKRAGERLDDAQALLDAFPAAQASQPRALFLRAHVALVRGFHEGAERLASEARRNGGHCQSLEILYELSMRRDAMARSDELAEALTYCPGGRARLAQHRRSRGDQAGAIAVLQSLVRQAPTRIELRLALARTLAAKGDARGAAVELEELAKSWPRDSRVEKQRAEMLELAGDAAGARRARERALRLDGSDLGLRRALALQDGREVLAEYAEDGREAIRAWKRTGVHPQTSSALVLDAAAVLAHPDGSYTQRIHQVIQVLDQRGVDRWGEVGIAQGAQVLKLRTIKADGRVLEPEEAASGEKSTISLPGLEPGDYLEYEFIQAMGSRGAAIPGFSADAFYFRVAGAPMFRSSYVVAAPAGTGLVADTHNMPEPLRAKLEGDREVLRVVRTDVPALVEEPGDPAGSEFLPFVQVGTGAGREALQLAIGNGALSPLTVEVEALARAILRPADGPPLSGEALIRAAYERVNERVEGPSSSWTEPASQVLSRGRGSRISLLKAVYRALGIRARLVLVRPFSSDPSPYRFPRPDLIGYAVLRVEHGGRTYWLDPNIRFTPFGVLASGARGGEALVLPEPGEAPEVTRAPGDDGSAGHEITLKVKLMGNGDAVIDGIERYLGYDGAVAKGMLERLDAPTRRQTAEQALTRSFQGLTLESLEMEGEGRSGEPLVLRWRIRVPQLLRAEEGRSIIEAPLLPVQLGVRYAALAQRETPLLIETTERTILRFEMELPQGLRVSGGATEVATDFGSYRRTEREEKGVLIREDRFELQRRRIAPGAYPAFARFAKSVDEAQEAPMVLTVSRR